METGERIINWYFHNQRELPWRGTKDPYLIWISEIIMQQTRIQQGLPYYLRFVKRFPDIFHLAEAPIEDVLLIWQGLGYYSRARNMHEAAKNICNSYNGIFPTHSKDLLKLKGIGSYTAAAIASFCFGEKIPAIDGNVNRVIARIFDINEPVNTGKGITIIKKLAEEMLSNNEPGTFNQAMMDFGSAVCVPSTPHCPDCPVKPNCLSFENQTMAERPVKVKNQKIKLRYFIYVLFMNQNKTLIVQRIKNDIWNSLFEFPLWEFSEPATVDSLLKSERFKSIVSGIDSAKMKIFTMPAHKLSHQTIYSQFVIIETDALPSLMGSAEVHLNELEHYAFPTLIINFLTQYKKEIDNI